MDRDAEISRTAAAIADHTRLEFAMRKRGDYRGCKTAGELSALKDHEKRLDRAIERRIKTLLKKLGSA